MSIKHLKVSTKDEGADASKIQASDWNAEHTGFVWSPDQPPDSPSSYDDEFESLTGWTTLGTLDTSNVTDFPSHWHVKRTEAGAAFNGIYKAVPSMPFTVTARLREASLWVGHQSTGIFLSDGTAICSIDLDYATGSGLYVNDIRKWTNRTSWSSSVAGRILVGATNEYYPMPPFQRVVVTSVSSIASYWSTDGYIWRGPVWTGQTTGLSAVTYVGLGISDPLAGATTEAVWDWIRFT